MEDKTKNKLIAALKNNKELQNTINFEGTEDYNVNAVTAEVARHTMADLKLEPSVGDRTDLTNDYKGSFDGYSDKAIKYVPSDGGEFTGAVQINKDNHRVDSVGIDDVVNYGQIETAIKLLDGAPLYTWDAAKDYAAVKNDKGQNYKLNTVIGSVEDLPLFEAYSEGKAHSKYVTPDSYDNAYITYSTGTVREAYFNQAYDNVKNTITKLVFNGDLNPNNKVKIKGTSFINMRSLISVHLNSGVSELGDSAFSGCASLKSIELPDSVETIGTYAFAGCSALTGVVLGSKVTSIKSYTFQGCSNLKSIAICGKITSIDSTAFSGCDKLTKIYFNGTQEDWNKIKPPSAPSTIIPIDGTSFPFLYICKDPDIIDTSLTSNKMFLKLPNKPLVEISKGAARLERRDSKTTGNVDYFTYDVLAAVIAGINSRLTALGSKDLALPTTLATATETKHTLIPSTLVTSEKISEELHKESDAVLVAEDIVPSVQELNAKIDSIELTEAKVKLAEDLYTYVPIGNAQKASNEVVGSGSTISATNRGKLGSGPKYDDDGNLISAGDSLKSVFNKIFGTQTDTQPSVVNSSVKLNVSPGTTSYGSSTTEYGTPISAKDVTITFTLANSGTAQYGYRCGNAKTTGSQTFYYPVTKQSTGSSESGKTEADLRITLPSGKTASSSMVTAGTYVHHSSNVLYCNFNSSNQVSIKISLAAGSVTTSQQTRYGQISASVTLGAAQKENQLTAGTEIDSFLTYLKNDATETAKLSGGTKTNTAGAYTIAAGKYYNYYLASTASSLSNDTSTPVTTATQFSSSTISITCTDASHIWFLLPPTTSGSKSIQYEPFANTWVGAFGGAADTTVGPVDVALTLDSGTAANPVIVTYKGYYTSAKAAAGSSLNYKIV